MLTDVQAEKFGMLSALLVYAQQANSGTDMLALSVQTEKPGTLIQVNANVQLAQHGTE